MTDQWKIIEQAGALNTAIAATATEQLVARPTKAPYFNFLIVQNFDPAVDTQILLDSGNSATQAATLGKLFRAQFNGGTVVIEPQDGFQFSQVVARNPDSAAAQTVSTISYQWGYKERV